MMGQLGTAMLADEGTIPSSRPDQRENGLEDLGAVHQRCTLDLTCKTTSRRKHRRPFVGFGAEFYRVAQRHCMWCPAMVTTRLAA